MHSSLRVLALAAIPAMAGAAELSDAAADEAIVIIETARHCRTEGYQRRSEALYRLAMAKIEQTAGRDTVNLIPALNGLAELFFDERRYVEAESLSLRSASLVGSALGGGHPLMATALQNLAAIYHVQEQYEKAEPLYLRALAIREQALGPDHPFVAATLADLAAMESARGDYRAAAQHYARAIRIREAAFGQDDTRVAETLADYARVLRQGCRRREARSAEARRREIMTRAALR